MQMPRSGRTRRRSKFPLLRVLLNPQLLDQQKHVASCRSRVPRTCPISTGTPISWKCLRTNSQAGMRNSKSRITHRRMHHTHSLLLAFLTAPFMREARFRTHNPRFPKLTQDRAYPPVWIMLPIKLICPTRPNST
uniref:Uncharacterized protein n=1 Tax=Mesocestoides corti TaxID=53468 RepID=A0A5K3G226_MESCO